MIIPFNLPHVFQPGSNPLADAYVLRVLLDALVKINLAYLRDHAVTSLYRSGVVYARTVEWEPIPALYARGFGDCKSLSCALIAEYLSHGKNAIPTFRWINRSDGGKDFHILVQTPDGYEDPSKVLGMR